MTHPFHKKAPPPTKKGEPEKPKYTPLRRPPPAAVEISLDAAAEKAGVDQTLRSPVAPSLASRRRPSTRRCASRARAGPL